MKNRCLFHFLSFLPALAPIYPGAFRLPLARALSLSLDPLLLVALTLAASFQRHILSSSAKRQEKGAKAHRFSTRGSNQACRERSRKVPLPPALHLLLLLSLLLSPASPPSTAPRRARPRPSERRSRRSGASTPRGWASGAPPSPPCSPAPARFSRCPWRPRCGSSRTRTSGVTPP